MTGTCLVWDAVLPGHETVELHVPGTYTAGCQLIHHLDSNPLALGIVLACVEVAAMHPWARLISSTLFPGVKYILVAFI